MNLNKILKVSIKTMSISILMFIISCNNSTKSKNFEVKKSKNGIVNKIYSAYVINGDTIEDGHCRKYYPNGQIEEISNWKNGKLNGQYKKFHINGVLNFNIEHLNGKRKDGEFISYNMYGKIYQKSNIIGGKREGVSYTYYNNGEIKEQVFFKNDMLDHVLYTIDINKNKMPLGTLKNGTGSRIIYHSNGKISEVLIYKKGDLKWLALSLDDKGNIRNSGNFADGIGELYRYDEFGHRDTLNYEK